MVTSSSSQDSSMGYEPAKCVPSQRIKSEKRRKEKKKETRGREEIIFKLQDQ